MPIYDGNDDIDYGQAVWTLTYQPSELKLLESHKSHGIISATAVVKNGCETPAKVEAEQSEEVTSESLRGSMKLQNDCFCIFTKTFTFYIPYGRFHKTVFVAHCSHNTSYSVAVANLPQMCYARVMHRFSCHSSIHD